MNSHMQGGMSEALRLTQEGRLAEATAIIQRALGGAYTPPTKPGAPDADGFEVPIEVSPHVEDEGVDDEPEPAASSRSRSVGSTLRPASKPSRSFRDARRAPGGWLGDLPGMRAEPSETSAASLPGQFVERSYAGGAGSRAYKLYIPSGYVGQAVPLVVMLHGCTQTPDDFSIGARMNALAKEQTFLVAYPAQSSNANFSKCWNWFEPANQRRGRGEPAVIAGITAQVSDEHHVADGRVYVAGLSSGGAMAAILGETYPDLYAAVGVHSGLAPGSAHDLSSAFSAMRSGVTSGAKTSPAKSPPLIVFHGDRDTTVHPGNADHLLERWLEDGSAKRRSTEKRGQIPGGYSCTRTTFQGEENTTLAERWIVHGLGHAWSGGSASGSYTDPKGPDASAEMIRFFNQHS